MINKKLSMFLVYALGVFTPFVVIFLVAAVLAFLNVEPPKNKLMVALSKWNIEECNDSIILINIQSEPNNWFSVGVERDPNTRLLQRVGFVRGREGQEGSHEAVFVYESKGIYDISMAFYGLSGLIWRDLNFDGRFDQFINYKDGKNLINVNNQWIQGMGKKDISTENSLYRFDPNNGEWKQISAIALPENQ